MAKHPRVEPIRNPTLFEMDKPEQVGQLVNSLNVERPYSEPGLLVVTGNEPLPVQESARHSAVDQPEDAGAFWIPTGIGRTKKVGYQRRSRRC
jgi:hypothetical protein